MKLGHISVRSPLTISVLPSGGGSLGQDKCGEPQQPPRTNTRYIGSVSGAAAAGIYTKIFGAIRMMARHASPPPRTSLSPVPP